MVYSRSNTPLGPAVCSPSWLNRKFVWGDPLEKASHHVVPLLEPVVTWNSWNLKRVCNLHARGKPSTMVSARPACRDGSGSNLSTEFHEPIRFASISMPNQTALRTQTTQTQIFTMISLAGGQIHMLLHRSWSKLGRGFESATLRNTCAAKTITNKKSNFAKKIFTIRNNFACWCPISHVAKPLAHQNGSPIWIRNVSKPDSAQNH